jgi:hypothetical protein
MCRHRPNSRCRAGHTLSAHTTSVHTCPPAVVSHPIASSYYVASCRRCPLFCYRPSLRQPGRPRVVFTAPVAAAPLHRASAHPPYRSAIVPSRHCPPSLLALAHVASKRCMAIKSSHLSCLLSALSASCTPLVSRHRHAHLYFPPHH